MGRGPTDLEALFLATFLSSFAVDWNVRLKVLTKINFFVLYQLPIPRLTEQDAAFRPPVERGAASGDERGV